MKTTLKFGTSGLRGLASDLIGPEARRYVRAFLRVLQERGEVIPALYLGGDFRKSSAQIINDCIAAAAELGVKAIYCGTLPTPALAAHAIASRAPSIMVTGSHIPEDRNGLKFYSRQGEICKADEVAIAEALETETPGNYQASAEDETAAARQLYVERYADFLLPEALMGMRIGVFEHSSVARDLIVDILTSFGAEITRLGRIEGFVAVDTEALTDPVFRPLKGWVRQHGLEAIVSTDGDADRPLLIDGTGRFVRGDVLGLLTAVFVAADRVVTPVTSNSAIEDMDCFREVYRTRVGSPYVIEAMTKVLQAGGQRVIGFEANGGTLLGNNLAGDAKLARLMTRDAMLPLLGTLGLAARQKKSVAELVDGLPLRTALSDRIESISQVHSAAFLDKLRQPEAAAAYFRPNAISRMADIDGLQFWLESRTMIHYRASGNAPELRCYVEADNRAAAENALEWGLDAALHALKKIGA